MQVISVALGERISTVMTRHTNTTAKAVTLAVLTLTLAGPAVAGDTWVLWAQTGRRPQPAATFDDKAACVATSLREAEAYVARLSPSVYPKETRMDAVSVEAGTVVRNIIPGKTPVEFVSAAYRCWPVGVNP